MSAPRERVAVYPGSFDPLTNGHVDIILRGARLFERIVVAMLRNAEKHPLFTPEERVAMAREVFREHPNVDVDAFDGMLVDYIAGKNKPTYTPFLDTSDHVIILNAEKVVLTGRKETDKMYRHHSGYPGGLRESAARFVRVEKPESMIERAVAGMLPKNRIGRKMLKKLKVYRGTQHPHQAQQPESVKIS